MKHFCETVAKEIIPAVRSMVAKELVERHKLTQKQAADKLGISQAAVSQYSRNLRGSKIDLLENDEFIKNEVELIANQLISEESPDFDVINACKICKEIRKKKIL